MRKARLFWRRTRQTIFDGAAKRVSADKTGDREKPKKE
jgi:hypothetical protein